MTCWTGAMVLAGLLAVDCRAHAGSARRLAGEGRKAEKKGDFSRAYAFYAQAAAADPANRRYWAISRSLRTRALMQAAEAGTLAASLGADRPAEATFPDEPSLLDSLTPEELAEAQRLRPPPELRPSAERKDLLLQGNSRELFERVAQLYGLDTVFDSEYPTSSQTVRLRLEAATFREAMRALQAATQSFIVPIGEKLFLVLRDTEQKRSESEPGVAVIVPMPQPVSPQEAQELARTVQQTLDIRRMAVDNTRRLVFIRDRAAKVNAALELFRQLLHHRPQVSLEIEFLEVARTSSLGFGVNLQTNFPVAFFGSFWNSVASVPEGLRAVLFGGGGTLFGLGLTSAEVFATLSRSQAQSLLQAEVRTIEGQPATFHVGDRYPILTAGYFGATTGTGEVFRPPPSFNFEDLGLTLKVTPRVHSLEEVSLDLEAEFKLLSGRALNDIPVISNRKFKSIVRMRAGQWAIVGGLMSASDARSVSGMAGLVSVPALGALLRSDSRDTDDREALLILKPRILSLPAAEIETRAFWVGSETRSAF